MYLPATLLAADLLHTVASGGLAAHLYRADICRATVSEVGAGCARIIREVGTITQNRVSAENTRAAYYPERDRGRTILDLIRLDPKSPSDHHRDTKDQSRDDLSRIIVYYSAAIRHDPNDDDAYFHRGLANFYAGAHPQALADLVQASKLDPAYPYYAIWIDLIDQRNNRTSRLAQAITHLDMTKWPAPVIRLFLGQTTPAAVLAAADDSDPNTRRGQVCEANFYSGRLALQLGAREEAARLLRLASAECPREFVEGPAAAAELKALEIETPR